MSEEKLYTLDEGHRYFGVEFNNRIFALLDKEQLNKEEQVELVSCAYASLMHWRSFSGCQLVNIQRGIYMLGKVHVAIEDKEKALEFAHECMIFTSKNKTEMKDFDLAYSHELMARASALNQDKESFKRHYTMLQNLMPQIEKEEDRKWLKQDMASGKWFGMDSQL